MIIRSKRRPQTKKCKQCRKPIKVAVKGRVPTYCGQSCKQRAYQRRRLLGPMLLLQQDLATNEVQTLIRRETLEILKEYGLVREARPRAAAPNRKRPTLRLVKTNEDDRSDNGERTD